MSTEPKREEVDALPGAVLLEFGTSWCGHCRRAQPLIAEALAGKPEISHIRIEDGAGKRLGRTFEVKRWPTLVFIKNGEERARLVRPAAAAEIAAALASLAN